MDRLEEEKLFEEYLAVRAKQAATEMQVAMQNSATNPSGAAQAKLAAAEAKTASWLSDAV